MSVPHKGVANLESFHRMNFLYQAAVTIHPHNPELSRFYIRSMRDVGEKTVVRMSPGLKAQFCKKCSSLLTHQRREVRTGTKGRMYAVTVCRKCGAEKKTRMRETISAQGT